MSTGEAIARIQPVVEAASDDELRNLWARRAGLGHPKFVVIVEGLLLAAMADRGLAAPQVGDDPPPEPPSRQPPASDHRPRRADRRRCARRRDPKGRR